MTLDEIRAALDEALPMRSPEPSRRNGASAQRRGHVERLEDYMLHSAHVSGNLVEARHWLRALRAKLGEDWERLQGWEAATTKPRAKLTSADIDRAKITVAPQHYGAIREARLLAESVDDQIIRFEREERVCSRAYTMAVGS